MKTFQDRMIEGARKYAKADRSDPFAFNRAMTHIANGICGFNQNGQDAFYDAEEFVDSSLGWPVKTFRNIKRP